MREFWESLKTKTWFRIISNRFVLSSLLFVLWMGFLDVNSWLIHHELDQELDDLKTSIEYYQSEIEKDEARLKQLNSNPENLEKFAREQYYLCAPGEEIFLIETSEETE